VKIGESQHISPHAVAQRFEMSLSGALKAPTEGSTRPGVGGCHQCPRVPVPEPGVAQKPLKYTFVLSVPERMPDFCIVCVALGYHGESQ
jgi:hypothetical protein